MTGLDPAILQTRGSSPPEARLGLFGLESDQDAVEQPRFDVTEMAEFAVMLAEPMIQKPAA